jgi:hypothetical protein
LRCGLRGVRSAPARAVEQRATRGWRLARIGSGGQISLRHADFGARDVSRLALRKGHASLLCLQRELERGVQFAGRGVPLCRVFAQARHGDRRNVRCKRWQ